MKPQMWKLLCQNVFVVEVFVYNIWKLEVLEIYQIGSYFLSYLIIMTEWMKPTDEWNNKNTPISKDSEYIFKEDPTIGCGVKEKGSVEDN